MWLQKTLQVTRVAPLTLLQGPSLASLCLHSSEANLGFERGASHSFIKAELILKEITISNISAFNSSKKQALPIGSFPCIEQKDSRR